MALPRGRSGTGGAQQNPVTISLQLKARAVGQKFHIGNSPAGTVAISRATVAISRATRGFDTKLCVVTHIPLMAPAGTAPKSGA